jgi:negative regulator of flagellin synthesis FlgM
MKVPDSTPVAGPVAPQAPSSVSSGQSSAAASSSSSAIAQGVRDRVSVDASKGAESSISAARRSSTTDRAARMQKLEASVRSGTYSPDPGRVAEQILSDAEVDARIHAIMNR